MVVPSGGLDSSNMSVNLDGRGPTGNKLAARGAAAPTNDTDSSSRGSSRVRATAGNGGALNVFSPQPGSITLGQVVAEAGRLGLSLLEVLVRVAVFVVKYTLKAFIWLVKAIGQWATAAS